MGPGIVWLWRRPFFEGNLCHPASTLSTPTSTIWSCPPGSDFARVKRQAAGGPP